MKTIRDSLSLFLSLFSSLDLIFGLYDLLYGFRAIRQIKFCLFGTIIYRHLLCSPFFSGRPNIYLFADVFDRLHHLKQRLFKKGKKHSNNITEQRLYLETLWASKEEKKRIHSKLIHPSRSTKCSPDKQIFLSSCSHNPQKQTSCQ